MDNPVRKMVQFDPKLLGVLKQLSEDTGLEPDQIVNLAVYELGRKLGHIKSVPRAVAPPAGIDLFDQAEPAPPPVRRPARPAAGARAAPVDSAPPPRPAQVRAAPAEQPRGDVLYLQVDNGPLTPVRKDVFLVGRGSKCDFVIQNRSVSREHAVVTRERAGWFIEDLNSANGTWLDGEQIGKYKLRGGEEVQISNTTFRFLFRPT